MARLISTLAVFLLLSLAPAFAQDDAVVPGLITANNVDVTADDGSLLAERYSVGDSVYVVVKPKGKKKGWVRVSRSLDDAVGFGWVEEKHIRTFTQYQKAPSTPGRQQSAPVRPASSPTSAATYSKIAVLPFSFADPDDPIGSFAYDAFSMSLKNAGDFQLSNESVSQVKIDPESLSALQKVTKSHNLDGVFVGKLSGAIGDNRLLQVKFYGKDRNSFVLEKVTRLPKKGNLQDVIDKLVNSCVEILSSQ